MRSRDAPSFCSGSTVRIAPPRNDGRPRPHRRRCLLLPSRHGRQHDAPSARDISQLLRFSSKCVYAENKLHPSLHVRVVAIDPRSSLSHLGAHPGYTEHFLLSVLLCIDAPEGGRHGTLTNGTAYIRGTYRREYTNKHTQTHTNTQRGPTKYGADSRRGGALLIRGGRLAPSPISKLHICRDLPR